MPCLIEFNHFGMTSVWSGPQLSLLMSPDTIGVTGLSTKPKNQILKNLGAVRPLQSREDVSVGFQNMGQEMMLCTEGLVHGRVKKGELKPF